MRLSILLSVLLALPASGQIVVNQGSFSTGDGSVTIVRGIVHGEAFQLFEGQLGSVLQSAMEAGDDLYLVSNSANRIEVVDLDTRTRVGQIAQGLSSPRYLEFDSFLFRSNRAYVTNHVYGGTSYVLPIDLDARTVGTPIPVDGLPETIAVPVNPLGQERKAYVALGAFGPGGGGVDSLAVLDMQTDTILRYIDIGCFARFVVTGADYAVADGIVSPEVVAFCEDTDEAVVVSADTDEVIQRLAFGEDIGDAYEIGQSVGPGAPIELPIRRASPPSWTYLVITSSGIAEVVRDGTSGEYSIERTIPIPDVDVRPVSAVAQAFHSGLIVLGRPDPDNPFSADGTITVHNSDDGALRATHPAGVYPVHVVLDEQYPITAEGAPEAVGLGLTLAGANPVRHHTAIDLALGRPASVRVDFLDGLGRLVATVSDGERVAGVHRLRFNVGALAPGTYVARAVAEGRAVSLPITVVR